MRYVESRGENMRNAIEVYGLTKYYGEKRILSNITFKIKQGEICGLIGENGAGKTTLMKILIGSTNYSEGIIKINGRDISSYKIGNIGCIIEEPKLYTSLTAYENMKLYCKLIGITDYSIIIELLAMVDLSDEVNTKVVKYSLGMKQRLAIAISLIGDPKILIWDEPINGLDPIGIRKIRNLILEINREKNVTFLISSHILDELDKVASKYIFINEGMVIKELSTDSMLAKKYLKIIVDQTDKTISLLQSLVDKEKIDIDAKTCEIKIPRFEDDIFLINNLLQENQISLIDLSFENEDLEKTYISILEDK